MLHSRLRRRDWANPLLNTALLGICVSCSTSVKAPQAIPDETGGPLANVILLPLTTRSTDNLLGHAWDVETDWADPLRAVLSGTVVVTGTEQHVTFFREVAARADLDANLGLASTGVWASRVTHVVYDVKITSLATFASGTQHYSADSGCCLQGNPTESCDSGYVYRLLRGSGTIRMLQRLEGELSPGVKEFIVARGGARYKVVDESTFNDAYFGLELSALQSVCRTLTPDQEMAPLKLSAPPNCWVHRYSALGEKESLARQLPNEELCRDVARRYCSELSGVISCRMRFGTTDEIDLAALPVVPPPEPPAQKPTVPLKLKKTAPASPATSDAKPGTPFPKAIQLPTPTQPAGPSN